MVYGEKHQAVNNSSWELSAENRPAMKKRYWDIPATLLLFVILTTISHRLEITNWTESLFLIGQLVLIAFFCGIFLGALPLHPFFVSLIGIIGVLGLIPWQLGQVLALSQNLEERYLTLASRLYPLMVDFFNNQPVEDNLLFLSFMALIYFSMSFLAGFALVRYGNPWIPLLVLLYSFLVTNHYDSYQKNTDFYAILIVFSILLLWGRLTYLKTKRLWRYEGIRLEYDTGYSHTRATLIYTFFLILLAWNIPLIYKVFSTNSPAQYFIIQSWENLREKFSNAVVGLNYSDGSGSDTYRSGFSLGSRAATNTQPFISVRVLTPVVGKMRYFWYGYSYDTFENGRWLNEFDTRAMSHPDDWPFGLPDWRRRHEVEFEFTVKNPLVFTFYAPNPLAYLSEPGEVILDSRYLQNLEVVAVMAEPALREGNTYRSVSLVSTPTEMDLRASGEEYPVDIVERYLQLPDDFPLSIKEKTVELTANESNPYDRVVAVTRYLRSALEYSDRMPPAPPDQNILEWVLFEYKKGFCNYYATLEVLMLRSIGIPARFSVGYAEGTYQPENGSYLVLKKDSHAWPEVYFPDFGWIEFEPTVSQRPLIYPVGSSTSTETPDEALKPGERSSEFDNDEEFLGQEEDFDLAENPVYQFKPSLPAIILIFLVLIGGFIYSVIRLINKLPEHPLVYVRNFLDQRDLPIPDWLNELVIKSQYTQVEKYYLHVNKMIRRLKIPVRKGWTPSERFSALINQYPILAESGGILLNQYQKTIYSEHGEDLSQAYPAFVEMKDILNNIWLHQKLRVFRFRF